jgi:hypothetical protein
MQRLNGRSRRPRSAGGVQGPERAKLPPAMNSRSPCVPMYIMPAPMGSFGQDFHGPPPTYENLPKEIRVDWEHPPPPIHVPGADAFVSNFTPPPFIELPAVAPYHFETSYYNDANYEW